MIDNNFLNVNNKIILNSLESKFKSVGNKRVLASLRFAAIILIKGCPKTVTMDIFAFHATFEPY